MKGHGEKLSRNQEKAIAALITHNSILAAAESIGIGEVRRRKDLSVARGLSVRMGLIVGLPLAVCCVPVSVFSPTDVVSVVPWA